MAGLVIAVGCFAMAWRSGEHGQLVPSRRRHVDRHVDRLFGGTAAGVQGDADQPAGRAGYTRDRVVHSPSCPVGLTDAGHWSALTHRSCRSVAARVGSGRPGTHRAGGTCPALMGRRSSTGSAEHGPGVPCGSCELTARRPGSSSPRSASLRRRSSLRQGGLRPQRPSHHPADPLYRPLQYRTGYVDSSSSRVTRRGPRV